jgi:hypothetical protein
MSDPQNRSKSGKFGPGNNANPGGRPKTPREMVITARELTPEIFQLWAEIMRDKKAKHSDRLRASENIVERGYGKAPQIVELQGEDGKQLPVIQVTFAVPTA